MPEVIVTDDAGETTSFETKTGDLTEPTHCSTAAKRKFQRDLGVRKARVAQRSNLIKHSRSFRGLRRRQKP